ncbi:MAG: 5'/3'-nucleotidase SurE [Pseudobutyrivibrio sp.]|nr:5'/3'-nucleotidase SurE [Pseudobutyrivibrio sp.]
MKKILIVNDDGIDCDGIVRLARNAQKYGKVWVVAPATQQSGASHSANFRTAMRCRRVDFPVDGVEAYTLEGAPADCTRVGVLKIVDGKPDLLLSGINYGYNAGSDTMYSGTVGAAVEGAFQGIPSIALSEGTEHGPEVADAYIEQILDEIIPDIIDKPVEKFEIINVNFPDCKLEDVKGIKRDVPVSKGVVFTDDYTRTDLEDGSWEYKVSGVFEIKSEGGTDLDAIFDNYIAIGRLRV